MEISILGKNGLKIVDINRRKAIKLKCLDCSGYYYKEVENCSFIDCKLYPFRNGKGKQNSKVRKKAIRKYCLSCCANQHSEVLNCPSKDCPLFCYRKSEIDRSVEIRFLPKYLHGGQVLGKKKHFGIGKP